MLIAKGRKFAGKEIRYQLIGMYGFRRLTIPVLCERIVPDDAHSVRKHLKLHLSRQHLFREWSRLTCRKKREVQIVEYRHNKMLGVIDLIAFPRLRSSSRPVRSSNWYSLGLIRMWRISQIKCNPHSQNRGSTSLTCIWVSPREM